MEIKLIALDLDGTLLTSDKKISSKTFKLLKYLADSGIKIVICTGRNYTDAKIFGESICNNSIIVSANGAYIVDLYNNKILYNKMLSSKSIDIIMNLCKSYNSTPCFHTPYADYYGNDFIEFLNNKNIKNFHQYLNKKNKCIYIEGYENWENVIKKEKNQLTKALLYNKDLNIVKDMEKYLIDTGQFEVTSSLRFDIGLSISNLEANEKGVTKGHGLQIISEYCNIDKKNMIAFGDGNNDISMLEYAGKGIVMGNCSNTLKMMKFEITDTNENDGIAQTLEKYL